MPSGITYLVPTQITLLPDPDGWPRGYHRRTTFPFVEYVLSSTALATYNDDWGVNWFTNPDEGISEYGTTGVQSPALLGGWTLDPSVTVNPPVPADATVDVVGWQGVGKLFNGGMAAWPQAALIRSGGATVQMPDLTAPYTTPSSMPGVVFSSGGGATAPAGFDYAEANAHDFTIVVGNHYPLVTPFPGSASGAGGGEWGFDLFRVQISWSSPDTPAVAPPLRQWQRNDGILDGSVRQFSANGPSSVQNSIRQGPVGTYL